MNHPITGQPFNFDKCCGTCAHFSDRTRTTRGTTLRVTRCAVDPEHRNLDGGTSWKAMPACSQHQPTSKLVKGKS